MDIHPDSITTTFNKVVTIEEIAHSFGMYQSAEVGYEDFLRGLYKILYEESLSGKITPYFIESESDCCITIKQTNILLLDQNLHAVFHQGTFIELVQSIGYVFFKDEIVGIRENIEKLLGCFLPNYKRTILTNYEYDTKEFQNNHDTLDTTNGDDDVQEKTIDTRKKNSYILTLSGLCDLKAVNPAERGLANRLVKRIEMKGVKISEDAVHNVLKEIPEIINKKKKDEDDWD